MLNENFRTVSPVRPAAPYVGGKRQLSKELVERIEAVPHAIYAEPFVGMGGVFLRRRLAPKSEVINDISGDVVTFFRILQRHYVPFMDELKYRFTSRQDFERLNQVDPSTLTDLERAVRFLYLQRTTFGGKVATRTFGVSPANPGRFDVTKLSETLAALNERLAGVVIENLPWAEFINRYDRAETLFYLDPPYWGSQDYYGKDLFPKTEFEALAESLRNLNGRFILSLNDVPEIRKIFRGFKLEQAAVTYSVDGRKPVSRSELIITAR
jgi:DNA adenine methylase